MSAMKPGSQIVLEIVESHLAENLTTELGACATIADDGMALRSSFDERKYRTWSKRMVIDPVRASTAEVAVKISSILDQLPIDHEIVSESGDRTDVLAVTALAERGSQRCIIQITFIQATERLFVHLLVATGVAWSAPSSD